MRKVLFAVILGTGFALAAVEAQAMPFSPAPAIDQSNVTQVRDGCGGGFFRNRFGRCRPLYRGFVRGYRGYYGRRCFTRRTPYGFRRVCRY